MVLNISNINNLSNLINMQFWANITTEMKIPILPEILTAMIALNITQI